MRYLLAIALVVALAGCGGGSDEQAVTTSTDLRDALAAAAVAYGREEAGDDRIASPQAKDALAAATADFLVAGGTIDEAAQIAQDAIEDDLGRELPDGTMRRVLGGT